MPRTVFFVTVNTWERRHILAGNDVHEAFLAYCQRGMDFGVMTTDYAIMPDHIHALVGMTASNCSLGRFVKGLRRTVSNALEQNDVPRPHWQPGFFDHLLRSDESYVKKADYVRQNPVRKGLACREGDWPYSGRVFDPGPFFL